MNSKNKVFKVATLILAIFLVVIAAVCSKSLVFAETSEFSDNSGMATDISDADSQNGAESTGEVYSYYDFLPRDVMPILGFVAMPNENGYTMNGYTNPSFITRTHFQTYKDAGFNIISGLYEREPFNTYEIRKAVDLAEELDLVYFVQDLDVRSDAEYEAMKELISSKWYLNKKSFGGISLKDEPSVNDFSSMSKVADVMRELAPGKVTHSTLFPWGASASQLGIYDMPGSTNEEMWQRYEVYVNRYMQEVNPELLAYDSYIFFYGRDSLYNLDAGKTEVLKYYIKGLSLYRAYSLESKIPYWVTVAPYNHIARQQIPKKHVEWNVNVSLAYGAKGIQYYTYWTLLEHASQDALENHQYAGLVTLGGTPHNTYYNVKDINENIRAVDGVLMTSTSVGLMQFGNQVLPIPEEDTLDSFGELKNITGGDALVGCFDHNGKNVYYIVNDSITAGRQTFNISFGNKCNLRMLNGETDGYYNNVYSVGVNLSGGEAVLIEVE